LRAHTTNISAGLGRAALVVLNHKDSARVRVFNLSQIINENVWPIARLRLAPLASLKTDTSRHRF